MTVSSIAAASTAPTAAATSGSGKTSLSSLTSNFSDFLSLLMTQLQNQDPTSPMDTNTFTSQLVQYASVEQQINTNSNLTSLIEATQSNSMLNSGAIVGKQAQVSSDHVALQGGKGAIGFNTPTAQRVSIGIYSDAGVKLSETSINSKAGDNTWNWDGSSSTGATLKDGSYKVVVMDSSGTALSTTTTGTVTGMQRSGSTVNVNLGSINAAIGKVQSLTD